MCTTPLWDYITTVEHQLMPLICETSHCSADSSMVVENPRLTAVGSMEGWLCAFPLLARCSEQRASLDGLPTDWDLGVFLSRLLRGRFGGFVWLVFFVSLCRRQAAALSYFRPSHLLKWMTCSDKIKEEPLFSISYRREKQHLGVFHSVVFIWYKIVTSALLRALTRWQKSRFPELILSTFYSTMSNSYNRFSSVKCYQCLLKSHISKYIADFKNSPC